jgi:hypothetical protein
MDSAYISTLISDAVPERQDLEYKRELPPKGNEPARDEFLKDVTAMANGGGGTIIYGIGEEMATRAPILYPIVDADFDAIERRLRQLLEMVEPRLTGVTFTRVAVGESDRGYVVALEIQQTLSGPYWNEKKRTFHVRKGPLVTYQSYQEIRTAFERGADAQASVARWIAERAATALRELGAVSPNFATMVCHLVPIAPFSAARKPFDIYRAHAHAHELPRQGMGFNPRWNLDGLRLTASTLDRYTQVYRNGAIELGMVIGRSGMNSPSEIPGAGVAKTIRGNIEAGCQFLAKHYAPTPVVVAVTLNNLLGHGLRHTDADTGWPSEAHTDRDHFPGMSHYLDDPTDSVAISGLIRETCDVIWQGFGVDRCMDLD